MSREQIAAAALELADRDGIDRLSMRRLADALGVGTMTIYGYFPSKQDLLDAAVDHAANEIAFPVRQGPWKEQLRELWRAVERSLAAHPSGIQLRLRRPLISPGALRVTEEAMSILMKAGFSRQEAAVALRTLFLYTFGFASFNRSGAPEEVSEEWREQVRRLPADQYPTVPDAAAELVDTLIGREPFEYGLDVILEGLAARL